MTTDAPSSEEEIEPTAVTKEAPKAKSKTEVRLITTLYTLCRIDHGTYISYSGKFSLSGLESVYFRGLIFVVCPEHVIIVSSLLGRFSWLNFCFWGISERKYPSVR